MALTVASWFARGRELLCFPDDARQAAYLQYYLSGNAAAVLGMLGPALAGPARMPALNWLAYPARLAALELLTDDGPPGALEDWAPADFLVYPWSGGPGASASLLLEADGPGRLLCDLAGALLPLPRRDRERWAARLQDAALGAGGRACGLSELARAACAASFLEAAGPGSPALRAAAPHWAQAASLAAPLAARAQAVASGLWSPLFGPAASPTFAPLTLWGLRSAGSVAEVGQLLLACAAPGNANLVHYLACQDTPQ